ncbi:MAG: YaiI/YqxD family protein [Bdellovibrionaceae bacterium]|nr:YaiI/YqxD family protein [Pseudobdellovibrionaceae bacterium]
MLNIYIDADGCAVKEETYKVAARYQLKVFVVANQNLQIPLNKDIVMKVVSGSFDAADDWIAENIQRGDVLVTSDLILADRCIKKGARVLGPKGRELDEENIGEALASRELSAHLRDLGNTKTGPSIMGKQDRSQFLGKLDQIIQSLKKSIR